MLRGLVAGLVIDTNTPLSEWLALPLVDLQDWTEAVGVALQARAPKG